jgi:hypothetical protein
MVVTEIVCEGVNSIKVAQDSVQWRVFMNSVIKIGSVEAGNFFIS